MTNHIAVIDGKMFGRADVRTGAPAKKKRGAAGFAAFMNLFYIGPIYLHILYYSVKRRAGGFFSERQWPTG